MYKIIIPSFKRNSIIKTHTLKSLEETDLGRDIYVFVANQEEHDLYTNELKDLPYVKIVLGVRGIPNQRNFIQRYFPVGERLLFIDDDIKKIVGLNKQKKAVKANKMNHFVNSAFDMIENWKIKMWGINSTCSPLEMQQSVSVGLIYIVGNFYGLINTHEVFVDEGINIKTRLDFRAGKESHERVLLMYKKYGAVAKFRCFGVESDYWGTQGGHQVSRNQEGEKEATLYLHNKYKDLTTMRIYKGNYDLQIKWKTKRIAVNFEQERLF